MPLTRLNLEVRMNTKKISLLLLLAVLLVCVSVLAVGCGKKENTPSKTEWPEAGVYYYDSGIDEYTLTLNVGDTFALIIKGQSNSGSYTLDSDGKLTLDFAAEGKADASAIYDGDVISLTIENSTMRFYKKVNYTVKYETNGGTKIEDVNVINGKTLTKPNDPTRDGYVFVGWYQDSGFTTPFAFGTYPVTEDTTVYAQWVQKSGADVEYNVMLDLNYDGIPATDTLATKGGQLFDLPAPEREGYTFSGWWFSTPGDGEKLSYQYKSGMTLDANTTLYALWIQNATGNKLSAPVVNIEAGSVKWNNVPGARSYNVKVINSDGDALIDSDVTATALNVPFADYPAGEYRIIVTALATTGNENNAEAVRYFSNKALTKVSVFEVFNSTLVFNTVENAERYYVTVVCGNPNHNHTNFDNGGSRVFSFANCTMPLDGIKFTVTATADGYASSTSDVFVYKKVLDKVGGLAYDPTTETVSWKPVNGAAYYMVSVNCANGSHNHGYVNNGPLTSIDVRECSDDGGKITVSVYPVTKGYASPSASNIECAKTRLATPSDIRVDGTVISWNPVENATGYEIKIGNRTYTVTECSYDVSEIIDYVEGSEYSVSIRATGSEASLFTDVMIARYYQFVDKLEYNRNTLTWSAVIGATGYEIQVNDGEIFSVVGGAVSSKITLTRSGVNVIRLRFVSGNHTSEWKSIEVFAYEISLDPRGGTDLGVQYRAIGDELDLPIPTKTGYVFDNWYNAPGGPEGNAMAYTDTVFAENGAIVLYAYYTPIKVAIKYNYGLGGGAPESEGIVEYERDYQLVVPTSSSVTSAFAGWYEAPYGMGIQYTDASGNSLTAWEELDGKMLYAFWVDPTLSFTKTKVNGKDGYTVSAGSAIALVQEVTVPATYQGLPVLMVASHGFENCTNLKVLNLPSSLESLSLIDPFAGCTSLEAINVYKTEGTVRYWSHNGVLLYNGANGNSPASVSFVPAAKTGTYRLPDGIVEISAESFAGKGISKIIIPTSVTKISKSAFEGCLNLTSVVFEVDTKGTQKNLTIDARAFAGCTKLDSIILPARLTEMNLTRYSVTGTDVDISSASDVFAGCISLSEINVSSASKTYKSVDGIVYSADGKTLLYCPMTLGGAITVPTGVQTVSPGAFINCSGLREVVLPNTINYVGECAFYNTKITDVTFKGTNLGTGVTIGKYAFRGANALSVLNLESGSRITTISEGAFYGCTSIGAISLPASLKAIGKDAFRGCTGIKSIGFADNGAELTFGEGAFAGCTGLSRIELPDYVSEMPSVFAGCTNISEIVVSDTNPHFESVNGVLYDENLTELIFFPRGKTGAYTIPNTVKIIGNGVFSGVTGLTRLVLPNSLEVIGDEAFRGFKITDTSADAGIVFSGTNYGIALVIGDSAFADCYIPSLALPLHTKSIGARCFENANVYKSVLVLNDGLESIGEYAFFDFTTYFTTDPSTYREKFTINIPGSVKQIGAYAFFENKRASVTLNEGLEIIGECAFMDTYALTSITIPSTVITIGNSAFNNAFGLEKLTINTTNSKLKTIGAYAFYATQITSVKIPKSVTEIGACAFSDCYMLSTVTFEEGGTEDISLGSVYFNQVKDTETQLWMTVAERGRVFQNCVSLVKVSLPSRLTELYPYTFFNCCSPNEGECTAALNVTFGENSRLTTIGEYAFYNCHLQNVFIPASIRNLSPVVSDPNGLSYNRLAIGDYAFGRDVSCSFAVFESVVFEMGGEGDLTIGAYAFYGASFSSITLPARLAPYTAYNGSVIEGLANGVHVFDRVSNLSVIQIEKGGKYYAVADGILYNSDFTELLFAPVNLSGKVTIPASVKKIHDNAFLGCTKVTEIVIEAGASDTVIGSNAFNGCTSLRVLVLPNNVVSLGANALKGCSSLTSLTLSSNLESFDYNMIVGCDSLKEVITPDGMAIIYSDNGVLYTGDKETLIYYPPNREGSSYTVLPGTKFIAQDAFRNNNHLETVILPDGLLEIKEEAFYNARSLRVIDIPATVELIGKGAFQNCGGSSNLITLTLGDGNAALVINEYAFAGSHFSRVEIPSRLVVLGDYAFSGVSALSEVVFAENSRLTTIGSYTFQNTAIREFTLPDNVVKMGSYNFYSCTSLISFRFNDGIKSIGNGNLERTAISEIYIPAGLTSMGVNNFANCSALSSVEFAPDTRLTTIPAGTFANTALREIRIPASVKSLGAKIILEEDEEVDSSEPTSYGVFEGCSSLARVEFESGTVCSVLGAYAFTGCYSIKSFDIPAPVVELGEGLFASCTGLTSMTIPHTVTKLGASAFSGCSNLADVKLLTKTTELPENLFSGCSRITNITIPSNVSYIGPGCFSGTSIASFDVAEDNHFIKVVSEILYNQDYSIMLAIPPKAVLTSITIPNGLLLIEASSFAGIDTLVEVVFEEGGINPLVIESGAFNGCRHLSLINLPARLESIGDHAFTGCINLVSINLPANLISIGEKAFYECYKLIEIYNESSLSITAGVTSGQNSNGQIADYAKNVYTPTSGASIINIDENGYITARFKQYNTSYGKVYTFLLGYVGNDVNLVIPEGVEAIYQFAFQYAGSFESIYFPSGVGMSVNPNSCFENCGQPILLFEDASVPSSWYGWNNGGNKTIFGYDGMDHTYTFSTEFGDPVQSVTTMYDITLPILADQGEYFFMGWYNNPDFHGSALSGTYYNTEKTDLYAKWMTAEEMYGGTDKDHAYDLELNVPAHVVVDKSAERVYFKFTVTEVGVYYIYSYDIEGQKDDTLGYVYDESGTLLKEQDKYFATTDWSHFGMEIELAPGTYYFTTGYYIDYTGGSNLGDYMIVLSTVKPE